MRVKTESSVISSTIPIALSATLALTWPSNRSCDPGPFRTDMNWPLSRHQVIQPMTIKAIHKIWIQSPRIVPSTSRKSAETTTTTAALTRRYVD